LPVLHVQLAAGLLIPVHLVLLAWQVVCCCQSAPSDASCITRLLLLLII